MGQKNGSGSEEGAKKDPMDLGPVSFRTCVMRLLTRTALNQAAEYDFSKDIRRYVATTPFGIEVFGRRGSHCFIHGLSCRNQNLDALPNLYQNVAIVLEVCSRGYWPVARDDLCLLVGLGQNAIDRKNQAI